MWVRLRRALPVVRHHNDSALTSAEYSVATLGASDGPARNRSLLKVVAVLPVIHTPPWHRKGGMFGVKYLGRELAMVPRGSAWQRHRGHPTGMVSVAVDASATTSIWPSSHVCVTQWIHAAGYGEQVRVATEPGDSSFVKSSMPFSGSKRLGQSGSRVGGGAGGGEAPMALHAIGACSKS